MDRLSYRAAEVAELLGVSRWHERRQGERRRNVAMKFYLGGPINGCTDEEANGWRESVKDVLREADHTWADPMDRDYRGREMEPGIAKLIVDGDKADIEGCDVLLMNAPKPSYGTAMEVFYGHLIGKPVHVVLPDDGRDPSPWIANHATVHRGSVIAAARELVAP